MLIVVSDGGIHARPHSSEWGWLAVYAYWPLNAGLLFLWGAFQSDVTLLGCDIQIPPNPSFSKGGMRTVSLLAYLGKALYLSPL
jgi:hypothetical protein